MFNHRYKTSMRNIETGSFDVPVSISDTTDEPECSRIVAKSTHRTVAKFLQNFLILFQCSYFYLLDVGETTWIRFVKSTGKIRPPVTRSTAGFWTERVTFFTSRRVLAPRRAFILTVIIHVLNYRVVSPRFATRLAKRKIAEQRRMMRRDQVPRYCDLITSAARTPAKVG